MKKEAAKKSKLWIWLLIGIVVLGAVAGTTVFLLSSNGDSTESTGESTTDPASAAAGRPELYWNLDKEFYTKDSESGFSTREPGEDGLYHVRFAYDGEQVELTVADKKIVNLIDTMDIMGLVLDDTGAIVDVINAEDIAVPVALNAFIQKASKDKIVANSSIAMNGMQYKVDIVEETEIYNVSDTAVVAGERIEATDFNAMDTVWVFGYESDDETIVTHIYMTGHPAESPVYWRAYQMWNGSEKSTSRVPDENGVYSIDFCADGGIVTLKCKDKSIVTTIDNRSPHSCHFGFVFDEEGYIVEIMSSGIGIRASVAAERIEVEEIDGSYFSGTQLIPSDNGLSYSATLPEDCIIYDASSGAARNGVQGQPVESLQLGDRICVWTDTEGTPILVYIANRLQDVPVYYNLVRKYDSTTQETTRERNSAGYYEFEVVETGKTGKKIVKTADKELASFIDSIANRIVGLCVNNGIIENAYVDDDVVGWTSVYGGYVPQIQGSIVSMVSFSKPDSPTNIVMGMDYKCYDVTGKDVPYGTETTLRVGDVATVTRNVSYNGLVLYVTRRLVGGDKVYYNLDYQYSSSTKETKRVPDEEGWYYFTMAHDGKQVEVKTKDKELANLIDKSPVGDLVVVMRVVDGVAYEVYDTQSAYGQVLRSGYRIKSVNGDGTYTVAASTGTEYVLKMASDCKIYNVSTVYDSHRGERIYNLKVGDMVTSLADYRGDVKFIYVRNRCVDNIYANKNRQYDSSNKVTLRTPDENGYYWFELAVDGELKMFKTNSKDIASQVDAYSTPFGLRVKDDEILNVTAATYAGTAKKTLLNGWDVTSVSKWSVGVQFNKVGYPNTGEQKTISLSSNVKIFDISPTAEKFGQIVSLTKGDRILVYSDNNDNAVYIYILFHDSRELGSYAYCEHCDKKVKWLPWAGGSWDAYDAHYYLAGDIQYSGQSNIGNQTKDYEIVLDLNGKKFEAIGSRGALIRYNDALTIIDSVGGGVFAATGINGGNGGTILMASEGILNLYSGTLSFIDSDFAEVKNGAVISAASSTINIYGGTITGGIVNSAASNVLGGNLYIQTSVLNMYGGVIENGQAIRPDVQPAVAAQAGNVYASKNSVINLYEGAEIRNGYSNQHGGNVFISTATLNMLGGKIYGGECLSSGGNLYNQFGGIVNVVDGVIENGTAGAAGNNIYGAHDTGEYHFSGGVVTGDITINTGKAISVSGTAKITNGVNCGLSIPGVLKLTIGEMAEGAEIFINAKGEFSEANEKAQAYLTAGYFKPAAARTNIVVQNNALVMQGQLSYCEHCGETVEWAEWTGSNSPTSGHYFIGKDFRQTSQISIVKDTDVVLDLYGHTYSSTKIRNFLVRGTLSIMDSVGGGEMVTTGGAEFAGAIALVGDDPNGSEKRSGFNLYSGTLRLDTENPEFALFKTGGLVSFNGGELNIYGGTMIGGHVLNVGGCISVGGATSVLNIMGGTITGGTSDNVGGAIYVYNELNMVGGIVEGDIYVEKGGAMLAGAVQIEKLTVPAGVLVDISNLAEGASVGIDGSGVFTPEMENPEDYLQYIHSANDEKDIKVQDNALAAVLGKGFFDKVNGIHVEAEKMTDDGVFTAGGDVVAHCPVCDAEVTWIDLNAYVAANGNSIRESGHYYLSADATIASQFNFYADACLHLNGHNITSSARALYVDATSTTMVTLNIMGEGIVTGAGVAHATIPRGTVDVGGTANFYGGTFKATGNNPVMTARGYMGRSIVNIYDGTEFVGTSANMFVSSQTVNVYGGKFTGGTTKFGTVPNALNIYGGTFSGSGQIILASGAKSALNISGGSFTGGSVQIAGDMGIFTVSGAPVIEELDLTGGKPVTLSNLTEGASIAVVANGAFTVANSKAADYLAAGYIVAAQASNTVYEHNGVLYMDRDKAYCEHCGQSVYWDVWPGTSNPASGHYYIGSDYTQTSQISIANNTDVVLDLRGSTYSSTKIRNFLLRGKLSIMDSVGGGEMVTTGGAEFAGGIALVGKDANTTDVPTLNLYSGTLRLDTENVEFATFANGGLVWLSNATMNVYGGNLIGGYVSQCGGCIKVDGTDAVLNIYDGTISGGTAGTSGGCIGVYGGTLNMAGGTVEGEIYVAATANTPVLSGATEISKLVLESGVLADVSGLFGTARIGVRASGVFTKDLTDANAYLAYFEETSATDTIVVEGNALAIVSEDPIETANAVHESAEKMTDDGVFNAGGTITAVCPVCGTEEQWIDITTVAKMTKITTAGHYYLPNDVENSTYYGFYANACLHLNGHNITSSARALYVDATSTTMVTLNIMGEGIVTGAGTDHATIPRGTVDVGGTVNFYGGTYVASGNNPAMTARGFIGRSVVNIYDGAEFTGPKMSLLAATHAVNMYGGKVTAGTVKVNGTNACEFNIYNGTVANSNEGQNAVEASGIKGTLNIAGGVIDGKVAVAADLKTVTVSGSPVVADLDLTSGKKLTIGEVGAADVKVTAEGAFTDTVTNADAVVGYFDSTDPMKDVVVADNALQIADSAAAKGNQIHTKAEKMTTDGIFSAGGDIVAECPVCGTEVTWSELNSITGNSLASGHYYLSDDLGRSTHFSVTGESNQVCLHLNGHNITSQKRALYVEYATVNIMGEGVITGSYVESNASRQYFASVIDSAGNVNLYGGTITSTVHTPVITSRSNKNHAVTMYDGASVIREVSVPGINVQAYDYGHFFMYGGIVSGASRTGSNGANIVLTSNATSRSAIVAIYGGIIENGTADKGGNIYASGVSAILNICGGTISGGDVYVESNIKSCTVSGAPVVSELDLTSGKLLTIAALKKTADITVNASGIFTENCANAEAVASCFKSVQAGKVVNAAVGKLVVKDEE